MGLTLDLRAPVSVSLALDEWTARVEWMRKAGVIRARWSEAGHLLRVMLDGGDLGGVNLGMERSDLSKISSKDRLPKDLGEGSGENREPVKKVFTTSDVIEVWDHWLSKLGKTGRKPKLDPKRIRVIGARLAEGHAVADLKAAVDGMFASQWHRTNGQVRPELCFRDTAHIERFMTERPQAPVMPIAGPLPPLEPSSLPKLEDTIAAAKKALESL